MAATVTTSIDSGLPSRPSALVTDRVLLNEFSNLYFAHQTLIKELTNLTRLIATYDEAATAGQAVAMYSSGGTLHVRLANATDNTKPCIGFCGAGGVSSGVSGEVILFGHNIYLTGLTPASWYYLDTTSGAITVTKPVGAGKIVQPIGFALTATDILFNPNTNWTQL